MLAIKRGGERERENHDSVSFLFKFNKIFRIGELPNKPKLTYLACPRGKQIHKMTVSHDQKLTKDCFLKMKKIKVVLAIK